MQLCHTRPVVAASFDEPNLVSCAGLVPLVRLAADAGLADLADEWLAVPSDKGANAGRKVMSLVAGMAAGADSIDGMRLLRHGALGKVLPGGYAPSTLGSFVRGSRSGMSVSSTRSPHGCSLGWRPGRRCWTGLTGR